MFGRWHQVRRCFSMANYAQVSRGYVRAIDSTIPLFFDKLAGMLPDIFYQCSRIHELNSWWYEETKVENQLNFTFSLLGIPSGFSLLVKETLGETRRIINYIYRQYSILMSILMSTYARYLTDFRVFYSLVEEPLKGTRCIINNTRNIQYGCRCWCWCHNTVHVLMLMLMTKLYSNSNGTELDLLVTACFYSYV